MITNKVTILPDADFTEMHGYTIRDEYDIIKQVSVVGTVISVPTKLVCDFEDYRRLMRIHKPSGLDLAKVRDINSRSMQWMPQMELKENDRVLFRYMTQANRDDRYFDKAIIMNYSDIFAILDNNNNPTMINGFILVNPTSETEGVVKYTSNKQNLGYLSDRIVTDTEVKVNDKIIFEKNMYRVINHDLYPVFDNGLKLWAMQGCNVISKI